MKWTKTPPTDAGWYWERAVTMTGPEDRVIQVVKLEDGTCHSVLTAGLRPCKETSRIFDLCWAGPIPKPEGCAIAADCEEPCGECLDKGWQND